MKYLIAGLGNIGDEYKHTRHNIGFDVADAFAAKHNAVFNNDRLADVAECKWKGKTFIVIKPTTYMNLSGRAVKYWMDKEKIPIENLLVILDDLALPIEVIRLRPGGSDAGHNGLKSIQESLGTNQYPRLRFGVGNNYPKGRQVDFVLSKWKNVEEAVVQEKINKSTEIIESFASIGIARTMNECNKLTFQL
ncbi:MAG: aminoacyl-tRNA hydrolase [Chitinophaga sp.]|uniref:aminoacyl-tRNA hydrolase n=1 Tax=Chitinophaga sp. TaxID=1869181 RepID=UPI001B05A6BA|nr:aminoacyl-tRNA hydrolase [Chitinophaga sp.]MBO9728014.1 aminoacyl-tRNA hydrolase [Chitinophaga sp.]